MARDVVIFSFNVSLSTFWGLFFYPPLFVVNLLLVVFICVLIDNLTIIVALDVVNDLTPL